MDNGFETGDIYLIGDITLAHFRRTCVLPVIASLCVAVLG